MSTQRTRVLLEMLMKEPGVSAVVLPGPDGRIGIRIDLNVGENDKKEIEALFGKDKLPVQHGTKRKHEERTSDDIEEDEVEEEDRDRTEERLLEIFQHNSGRECHRLRPDVWTSHGKWTRQYRHLDGRIEKQTSGAGGSHGRVTNRPFVTWFHLNGKDIQAGIVLKQADDYTRIAIAFTRASSAPPTYGLQGMFDRARVAAKAWVRLSPLQSSLMIALPRARVASKWPLEETRSLVAEMHSVLNVAADGMTIELLSVGIDGLTTDLSSLQWLQTTWGHRLRLRLVIVVSPSLPGTMGTFPTAPNGIRYGEFELADVCEVLMDPETKGKARPKEFVEIIQTIREMKLDRDEGYTPLNAWTSGRANFRVCPDSAHESGVNEEQRQSRSLR